MGGHGCNGYYTGVLGPGLLYDGLKAPFLPHCSWRNLDRAGLSDRSWFERPCLEEDWAEGSGPWALQGFGPLPAQSFIDCSRIASASRFRPSTRLMMARAGGRAGWT